MTENATLSAVDLALSEVSTEGFRLTDDIIIPQPTRKLAERLRTVESDEEVLELLCGEQYPAAKAVLEALPLAVEIRVLELMLKHLTADLPTVDELADRLGLPADVAKKAVRK